MGTIDRHYLYAPGGRVAVFTGADGYQVSRLELYAPAEEIARFAALFTPAVADVNFVGRWEVSRDSRRAGANTDDTDDFAHAVNSLSPFLSIGSRAWPATRRLLRAAWGIDIADHPTPIYTESKYTIDINSSAISLLAAARIAALEIPSLRERAGEIQKPSRTWPGHFGIDYYGWPSGIADATDAMLRGLGGAIDREIEAAPRRWANAARRSGRLYQQHEQNHWIQPGIDDAELQRWRPDPNTPERIMRERSRGYDTSASLYPGDDAGLAMFADHDLRLRFGTWRINLAGPLADALAITKGRIARTTPPNNDWGELVIATATIDEETRLSKRFGALNSYDGPIATAYLISREHRFAMLLALGYANEHTATAPLEGASAVFGYAISPALPLPDADSGEALIAALGEMPWTLSREAAGADLNTDSFAGLVCGKDVFMKRGVVQFGVEFATADPEAPRLRANRSQFRSEDDVIARPALIEIASFEAEPRSFVLDPDTGTRSLDLAFANIALSLEFYADNLSAVKNEQPLSPECAGLETLIATLRQRIAAVKAVRAAELVATWVETDAGFAFDATIPLPDGASVVLHRDAPVGGKPDRSPVDARKIAQRSFVNNGIKDDLVGLFFPEYETVADIWRNAPAPRSSD